MKDQNKAVAAGLRGAFWDASTLPPNTNFKPETIVAQDSGVTVGVTAQRGGERCAVLAMHPREFLPTHYLVPALLKGGAAVMMQAPRSIGNDIRLEHETALLDVAAGIQRLRQSGYEHIVLLGNSGGAGLYSFYCQQANTDPANRIAKTPAGKPVLLPEAILPQPDGVIFLAPHPGQGTLLLNALDPSVTDEDDALSMDPALFPFNPANGFQKPPRSSNYSTDFIQQYRAAQTRRAERIDQWAKEAISEKMEAKQRLKKAPNPTDMLVATHTPIKTLWRTDADLRCYDLSLDPSPRRYGSLWGFNPFASNLGSVGFARSVTPDSWLSTWSGLSSNALMSKTAKDITQPTLVFSYDGDNSVFPSDLETIFSNIGADDKVRAHAAGDHHGRPILPGEEPGQAQCAETLCAWLQDRFI